VAERGVQLQDAAGGEFEANGKSSLMTAEEVGALLGVPRYWVYAQSRPGWIPTVTLGRYRRYRPEAIAAWVAVVENRTGSNRRPALL